MAINPKLEEIANMLRRNQTTSMIAPNEYTDRTRSGQASIDRRNKMIELLQGQADAPIERFSYGGIEAVTPPAAYLAKILSGAMAGYQSGKAGQEQEALDKYKEQAQTQDRATMIEMLQKGGTVPTDVSSVNDTSYITNPDEREKQNKFLAGPVTSPSGEIIMSSSGQPLMPVNEIQAREYNFKTPEGQMELLRQTAAEKQSRAEMLTRQIENQAKLDLEARTVQNKIDADKLRNDERIAAADLANRNIIENQIADDKRQRDRERAEYGLPPEDFAGTSTPSAGTPTSSPMTLAEAKMQQALDQKKKENTQTKLFEAQKVLPKLEKDAESLFDVIDSIATFDEKGDVETTHPGFTSMVGSRFMGGAMNTNFPDFTGKLSKPIAGSDSADFQSIIDQLNGKTFLEAFASIKGGGTITETEGLKATQAIAALGTSQSEKQFLKNLRDFRSIVQKSLDDARTNASENPPSVNDLKEGVETDFDDGQTWTLRNNKAVRLN